MENINLFKLLLKDYYNNYLMEYKDKKIYDKINELFAYYSCSVNKYCSYFS